MRFFSRMSLDFRPSMMGLNLSIYSGQLPKWGSMQNGDIYEHQILDRPTAVNAGYAWPTPSTMDKLPARSKQAMDRNFNTSRKGRTAPSNLREAVHPMLWPTPRGRDLIGGSGSKRMIQKAITNGMDSLPTEQMTGLSLGSPDSDQPQGELNPAFVELLMGFPVGWTSLDGLPDPMKISTAMNRPGWFLKQSLIVRHGLKHWGMPLSRKSSTRFSSRYMIG